MTTYTLNVSNHSTQSGSFSIFQKAPDTNTSNVLSLAWLAKPAHPTTNTKFTWDLDYSFVWSKTTNLKPGAVVKASQVWTACQKTSNRVDFDLSEDAYTFSDQRQGEHEGNLYINQTKNVQSNNASVGIGMSGKAAFLVESQPNMKIVMTPKPEYWIAFGDFQEGEVLDVAEVTKNAHKLQFDDSQALHVALGADNTWSTK